jgi:hypothetical protein
MHRLGQSGASESIVRTYRVFAFGVARGLQPSRRHDGIYGSTTGPWTTEMFIEEVYKEVAATPAARSLK